MVMITKREKSVKNAHNSGEKTGEVWPQEETMKIVRVISEAGGDDGGKTPLYTFKETLEHVEAVCCEQNKYFKPKHIIFF